MRITVVTLAFLVGCLLVLAHMPLADAQTPAAPASNVLPNINIQGGSVEDVIDLLRQQDSTLQIMVARDPDAPSKLPDIHLKLKNVTAADVLKVLSVAYSDIELVPSNDSPIVVVKVHAIPGAIAPPQVVRVYSLSVGVQGLKAINAYGTDKALVDAMSLVQAALAQTPQSAAPTLQVHEATMTLIVKATTDQQETVAAAIKALQANAAPATRPGNN